MISKFILIILLVSLMPNTETEMLSKTLSINLEGVKNDRGYILISLFSKADGFPDDKNKADKIQRIKAQKGTMKLKFDGLDKTTYAFAIIHDENDNKKLDTGFFGIPKEGFCFSNNATGTMGPPNFEDATFKMYESKEESVKIKYW